MNLTRYSGTKEYALKKLREHYKKLSMLGKLSHKSPFYILISTVLSQRNRDSVTLKVVKKFFSKYRSIRDVANADLKQMSTIIKQSGFYKTKARRIRDIARILIRDYKGKIPQNISDLLSLPGVGRKTANCVLVYAYRKPAIPVDTHVHRISNRLGWVRTKTPEETEHALKSIIKKDFWSIINEVFVIHGQNICLPRRPRCNICPIAEYCKKVGV
ncbi:MAG: endonuclease III [Candidatus Woesearchaeota archaeon]